MTDRAATGRARARELGIAPGTLPTGPHNAITDVPDVRVGHSTLVEGSDIRTGVTAIVHDALLAGNASTLAAGLSVFNGYGKIVGSTQVDELGVIETPVLLTATLSVFRVADALLSYLHALPGNADLGTINPVVAETNDSYLSDIWARPITEAHVHAALAGAAAGPVAEGCVGAGTGTGALGYKAGIGTSSRRVELPGGTVTVGVLVQANFGGTLTVQGTSVPPEPAPGPAQDEPGQGAPAQPADNSCVIVLCTDAALDARQLRRLARRSFAGMARTGSDFAGHSGDYALAVSTTPVAGGTGHAAFVPSENDLDMLFAAAIDATEESILNSLLMAETTTGILGHVRRAVPLERIRGLASGRPGSRSES
jgi:D-aminopeptidase